MSSDITHKLIMTLPTDSATRKDFPILSGCIKYFPAALAGVANVSKLGNDKHNPGEALHHARGKSMDHGDCIVRHLMDTEDLLSAASKAPEVGKYKNQILAEASSLVWRALAYSQELHERFGAPLAPAARLEKTKIIEFVEPIKYEELTSGAALRRLSEQFGGRTCTTADCQICNPGASRA